MNTGKYIFAQLTGFVDRYEFDKCVNRYSGNYRAHRLNSWNHFLQLLFGQITGLNSISSICVCLKAHKRNLYHLGIKQSVNVSNLSRAGESRDWRIFADFGNYLIEVVRPMYVNNPIPNINVNIDNEIFVLDSTSISCSINLLVGQRENTAGVPSRCTHSLICEAAFRLLSISRMASVMTAMYLMK